MVLIVNLFFLVCDLWFLIIQALAQECAVDSSNCYSNGKNTIWWELEGQSEPDNSEKLKHPVDKIQNALKNVDRDGKIFGRLVAETNKPTVSIESRYGFVQLRRSSYDTCVETELCKLQYDFRVKPKWVGDGQNKMAIVHTEKHQIVLPIKVCRNENDQNSSICVEYGINNQPETACRQLKSSLGVLVYDETGDQLKRIDIEYPSACICAQIEQKMEEK